MYKALTLSIIIALSTTACGFHLKGSQWNVKTIQDLPYPYIKLDIPEEYHPLSVQLQKQLLGYGVKSDSHHAVKLKIADYQLRRQQMNGKLTEVLLQLQVVYYLENAQGKRIDAPKTVRAYRHYQYDIESVNTENQQEQYLIQIMLEDIAQQMSHQLVYQPQNVN